MQETEYEIIRDPMNVNRYLLFIKLKLLIGVFLKENGLLSYKIEIFTLNM